MCRSQKAETVKAGKSSAKSADRRVQSLCDTEGPADMDSCMIDDETVLADRSSTTADQSLHAVSKQPSVNTDRSITSDSTSSRAVAENADTTETTPKSTSRLFDLVNADSPVAQVS